MLLRFCLHKQVLAYKINNTYFLLPIYYLKIIKSKHSTLLQQI